MRQDRGRAAPLRRRLLLIALSGMLPLAIIAGICFVAILRDQRQEMEQTSLNVARLSAVAVDVQIERAFAVLGLLAAAPELTDADLAGYERLLRHVLQTTPGWTALQLLTPDRRLHLAVPRDPAGADASGPPTADDSFRRAVESGRRQIGGLTQDRAGRWVFPMHMPVLANGRPRFVLTAFVTPDPLVRVLEAQRLPETWTASVSDVGNRRVARSRLHAEFVGRQLSPSLIALLAPGAREGTGIAKTIQGIPVYTAYVRLPESGWVLAVGLPTSQVLAGAIRSFAAYGGGIVLSLLLAVAAALYAARRIHGPVGELLDAAQTIATGAVPPLVQSNIQEVRAVSEALVRAAEARRDSERERESLLIALEQARVELTQRVSELQRLHLLSNELLGLPSVEPQLQATLHALCDFHSAPRGLLLLGDESAPGFRLAAAHGFSDATLAALEAVGMEGGPCTIAMREGRRVVVADLQADPLYARFLPLAQAEGVHGVHSTPLRTREGRLLGVISVYLNEARLPSNREVHLADLCAGLAVVFLERAHAEAVAGESERRLRLALDASPVPFKVLTPVRDADGHARDFILDYLNPAAATVFARPEASLRHGRLSEVLQGSWDDPALLEAYAGVVERRDFRELEFQRETPAGTRWFRVVASPFQNRVAVWFEDVSERKLQEQLLHDADRRKDEFLATLAHELRNPLAPIRQAAMLAGLPQASDAQKRWSQEVIERQVRHMALLLDDLLDVSRITRGKMQLRKSVTELHTVVDAALETARPLIEAKGHELALDLPPRPLQLEADSLRLSQILANLLTNAAKYTPQGGRIELRAEVRDGELMVDVQDNGIGIAAEDLDAVFGMFNQVRGGQDAAGGGLGIGLALARGLAQLHGGGLSVHSEGRGRGSRFRVQLPLGAPAPAAAEGLHAGASLAPPGRRCRILVADDNRDAAETLADVLRMHGHEVALAFDGEEALSQWQRQGQGQGFDVAILDIGMPRLNGHDLARRIRERPDGRAAKLIALTGWGQFKDQLQSLRAGFDHHLTKPAEPQRLLALIQGEAASLRSGAQPLPSINDA